jgi:hypothetical protein
VRSRVATAILALVTLTAVVATLGSIVKVTSQTVDRARDGGLARDLAPIEMAQLDPRVFLVADRVMGAHDTYTVVTGRLIPGVPQIALDAAPQFAPFWLLPRRYVYPPGEGRWIISYGADLRAELPRLRFARRIAVSPGVELVEVAQ